MTLLERIDHYTKVFSIALPHVKAPTPSEAIRWCEYPQASVELSMLRAAKKFAPTLIKPGFDPTDAYVYITGTARLINGQSVSRVKVRGGIA
jgi:hypothetical protein